MEIFQKKNIREIIKKAIPGAGACGGMYTANTMASAIEAMGMTLPIILQFQQKIRIKKPESEGIAACD